MLNPDDFGPLGALVVASENGKLYIIPENDLQDFEFDGTTQLKEHLEDTLILEGRLVNLRAAKHIVADTRSLGAEASAEAITRSRKP